MIKRSLFLLLSLGFFAQIAEVGCQNPNKVEVSNSVVDQAAVFNIDYGKALDEAKTGRIEPVMKFINIHKYVDGVSGLEHGLACIELIPLIGDGNFAQACSMVKPGMRKLLVERLPLSQARSKNTALHAPLKDWAPLTWATINEQPIPAQKDSNGNDITKPNPTPSEETPGGLESSKKTGSQGEKPAVKGEQ
jgi:hypothetical protein